VSRSLDDLRPEVRPMVDAFLAACAAAGIEILITCTSRTLAEQAALYAQGRTTPGRIVTNAKPGQSAHNFGLALDVVPIVNGKPDWHGEDYVWKEVGNLGETHGLQWLGAPGSKFIEQAHFQHPDWVSLASGAT
jgi:peptidoglycan L-alanyl-D-glutamate endopeptidase CwlK